MPHTPTRVDIKAAQGLSNASSSIDAARQASEQVQSVLAGATPDLLLVFISRHHAEHAESVLGEIRRILNPVNVIGTTGGSVLGGAVELEGGPGVSLLALRIPGLKAHPFRTDPLHVDLPAGQLIDGRPQSEVLREQIGVTDDHRVTLLFADPFSAPMVKLIPALSRALRTSTTAPAGPLFGGLASAASGPGQNALFLNGEVFRDGGVGLSLSGPFRFDTLVSQGCRAFGPTFVITKSKANLIFELGGRRALDVIQETVQELADTEREKLRQGLFMGRVVNEYKDRFGRNDFLVRNVVGVDEENAAVAVNDLVRPGTTVRLHLRDAATAREDLAMLLDAQSLHERPKGVLLVTCNARGQRLFSERHTDTQAVARAFASAQPGAALVQGGVPIISSNPLPLAGFFAAGEIGPLGGSSSGGAGDSFIHGHTACIALFREA